MVGLIAACIVEAVLIVCIVRYFFGCSAKAHAATNGATTPVKMVISEQKLKLLLKLYGYDRPISASEVNKVNEMAVNGDHQAAVVVSISPLLVAAYSEEMDCVAMLKFPREILYAYNLCVGSQLLTANVYQHGRTYAKDLIQPERGSVFSNMQPIVLNFLTDNISYIADRAALIPEQGWNRARQLGSEYLEKKPGIFRSGNPLLTDKPLEIN